MRPLICLLILALAAPAGAEAAAPFMKGMVISCPRNGQIWGTPDFASAIEEAKGLGVDWVQIHPYARIGKDGSVSAPTARQLGYLIPAIAIANKAGVKMMWKPHLAYWGNFSWRGAISFEDEAKWQRFFRDYREWMLDHARFAEKYKVPVLVVGTELERMVHRPEWRPFIAEVRKVYSGKITWAANWDGVQRIQFWDALDYIGVQAYFPLGTAASTDEAFRLAFRRNMDALDAVSKQAGGKPILFTEVGYARSKAAADKPWEPQKDNSKEAIALRTRLMDVVLSEMKSRENLHGAFWWKWIPGSTFFDRDFSMKNPEARRALKAAWLNPKKP